MEQIGKVLEQVKTLAKSEQTSAENTPSRPSKESWDTVADWVTLYAKMYPQQEWDEGLILAYREGLEQIEPTVLHRAFKRAMRDSPSGRRGFRPSVGEICEAAERESDRLPAKGSAADPNCKFCAGTGWKLMDRDGGKWAVACDCTKAKSA